MTDPRDDAAAGDPSVQAERTLYSRALGAVELLYALRCARLRSRCNTHAGESDGAAHARSDGMREDGAPASAMIDQSMYGGSKCFSRVQRLINSDEQAGRANTLP